MGLVVGLGLGLGGAAAAATPIGLAPVAALLPLSPLPAAAGSAATDGSWDIQLTQERSSGRYRQARPLRIDQTTLAWRWRTDDWQLELQWPWLRLDDAQARASGGPEPATVQGPGDAWLKATLALQEAAAGWPGWDLALRLKTATGDAAKGLGSGALDGALQLEALLPRGPWTGFGHLGWRHTGEAAGQAPLRNPWFGEVGLMRRLADGPQGRLEGGLSLAWREPVGRLGAQGDAQLFLAWSRQALRWQLHASRGWREASPDWAAGFSLRQRF